MIKLNESGLGYFRGGTYQKTMNFFVGSSVGYHFQNNNREKNLRSFGAVLIRVVPKFMLEIKYFRVIAGLSHQIVAKSIWR